MNTKTGEIKAWERITETEKKSGEWAEVPAEMLGALALMDRRERVRHMQTYASQPTLSPGPSKRDKRQKRKAQRLARRRNR